MDQFFKSLPKSVLAFLIISAGIAFFIIIDPPHTLCDSQLEVFKKNQQGFLYTNPKNKSEETPRQEKMLNQCKISNSPGGCYEYFLGLKGLLKDVRTVPDECLSELGDLGSFKKTVWEGISLLADLAWGEKPPETYFEKFGWLNTADVSLFCHLKNTAVTIYGREEWKSFREKKMLSHKGAENMDRKTIWEKTMFSVNCSEYP